jgi:Uma2 family endonuclease
MTTIERPGTSVVVPANWVPGPRQGEWTYLHYAALPDDGQRYEIIDGALYAITPAPSVWHQKVVLRIARYLSTHVEDMGRGQVFIAPIDVELAYNVVVQPDILVILNEGKEKITPSRIIGAPDLVVEVSSPGTAGHDRREKQDAYAHAGIPEYWIADPLAQTVELLILDGAAYRSSGVFQGKISLPSSIIPALKEVLVEQFFV